MTDKQPVLKLPVIFESDNWKVWAILSYGHNLGRKPLWTIELYKKVKPEQRKPFQDEWKGVEIYSFRGRLTRWNIFSLKFWFGSHGFPKKEVKGPIAEEIRKLYQEVQDYMDA